MNRQSQFYDSYNGSSSQDHYYSEDNSTGYASGNMQCQSSNYMPYLPMYQQTMYYQQSYQAMPNDPYVNNTSQPLNNMAYPYGDNSDASGYHGPPLDYASRNDNRNREKSYQGYQDDKPSNAHSTKQNRGFRDDSQMHYNMQDMRNYDSHNYTEEQGRGRPSNHARGRSNYSQSTNRAEGSHRGRDDRYQRVDDRRMSNNYSHAPSYQSQRHYGNHYNDRGDEHYYYNELSHHGQYNRKGYNNYNPNHRGNQSYQSGNYYNNFRGNPNKSQNYRKQNYAEVKQNENFPKEQKNGNSSSKDTNQLPKNDKSNTEEYEAASYNSKEESSPNEVTPKGKGVSNALPGTDEKKQKDKLVDLLSRGTYECMVCCDHIKQHHSIWSCDKCFNCFHLNCTKKWAETSREDQGWRCPACQNTNSKFPNIYYCFCHKMRNPEWDRRELPHSCGEICGKKRGPSWCTHKCNTLCHPGPCPDCPAFMIRVCPCGKSSRSLRCSQMEAFLCSKPCQKLLNCEKHVCEQDCHEGDCEDCEQSLEKSCYCGKKEKIVTCTEEELMEEKFCCGQICCKKLACGNHSCEEICHKEECKPCDKAVDFIVTCPCLKALLSKLYEEKDIPKRISCSDPIPTCGEICEKQLKCGTPGSYHQCQNECHEGLCPPCQLQTNVKCRCGNKDCKVPCAELFVKADEVICEKQCKKLRQCGRHKCGSKCCIDSDHVCARTCGRSLKCRLHKCEDPCHRGNCPRCWQTSFDELSCHCGASVLFPPIPCGTEAPSCDQPCRRPQPCTHPVTHSCHMEEKCPPCTELVSKLCFGDHVMMKITPCYVKAISCGEICDKIVSCGVHKCEKVCHDGPCLKGAKCKQKCTKLRSTCEHPCARVCHAGGPCPDTPCKVNVTVRCSCGNRKGSVLCDENEKEYRTMATSRLASIMQQNLNAAQSIDISQIFSSNASKADRFQRLECNDDCLLIARNQRLALALQITNPETRDKLGDQNGIFSESLKDDVKKDTQFCTMVHHTLHDLVIKARESKQKSRSHSFCPMNKDKRRFIHEYAKHFGCQTQAYDEEPKKNVVVTAAKGLCCLPPLSVIEVVQKERGKRKVPGPVLNRKSSSKDDVTGQLQKLEKNIGPAIDYFDFSP